MAGPFYPPNPTQFPALPNKSKQPGAATYGVDANVVGGAREVTNGLPYNLNTPVNQEVQPGAGTGIELTAYGYEHCGDNHEGGGEATTDQRREHQDGVHNPTESLNPNPVNQGHGVQQTLPQAPPVIAPFENPSYDLGLDLNLPADFLANVELDDSWVNGDTGTSFFDLAPLPEVPEGALGPAGQEFQQPPPNQQETSESGLKFEGDSFERLESVSAKPQTEIAKHEATVNDIPSQEVKAAASTSYFENEIEYQEAEVAPQPQKKEEKKPKKPRKKQNRNKAPRQNSAAARDDPENYTLPMLDQMHWSIDNLPDIMYQFKPIGEKGVRPREKKPSPYPGEKDLTVFPILPDRISSNVEEFRLEAWQRLDRRIELKDISARIIPRCRPNHNAIQQRTVRFRKAMKMVSWGSGNKKTPILGARVRREMILKGIDPAKNSTRGLTPGLIDPSRGEAGGRIPPPKQYKKLKDNAPPPPQSYIDIGLRVPSHVIAAWELRLTPYEYAVALQHQVPGGWYGILQIARLQRERGREFGPFDTGSLLQPGYRQQAPPPSQTETQSFNAGFLPAPGMGQQTLPAPQNQFFNGFLPNPATQSQTFNAGPLPSSGPIQQGFPTPQNQALNAGFIPGSTTPQPAIPSRQPLGFFPALPASSHTVVSAPFRQVSFNTGAVVKEEDEGDKILAESVESQDDEEHEEPEEEVGSEDNYDKDDEDEDEYDDEDEDQSDETEDYQPTDDGDSADSSVAEDDGGESDNERQSSESSESIKSNGDDQLPQAGHEKLVHQLTGADCQVPQTIQTDQATQSTGTSENYQQVQSSQSTQPSETPLTSQTSQGYLSSETNQTVQDSKNGDSASFKLMDYYYARLLPNMDLTDWENVLDYNRVDDEPELVNNSQTDVQTSYYAAPTQEQESSNAEPDSYVHTLAYWDQAFSTEEFDGFGHQAVLVPNSPPLIPRAQPGCPQPTTRESVIRAQTERTQQPRSMTKDTISWGNAILTNATWVPNMPALTDYEGQAAFETGLGSIGHHPHLSPKEPAFWDRNFEPFRALAGYTYSKPRIQVGTTPPAPHPQPQPQPQRQIQSQYRQQPLFQIKRRRDENDQSISRAQARDQVKRRRLEDDARMRPSGHIQAQPSPEVARATRYMNCSPLEQSIMDLESISGQPRIRISSSENGYLPRSQTPRNNGHFPAQSRTQTSTNNGYVLSQPATQNSMSNGYLPVQLRTSSMNNGCMPGQLHDTPVSTSDGHTVQFQPLSQLKRKRDNDASVEFSGPNANTKSGRLEGGGSEMRVEFS